MSNGGVFVLEGLYFILSMTNILFVCLGNICRSAAAETIMLSQLRQAGLQHLARIDSAGILSYHQGEPADARMRAHAARHGYTITHLSRPVRQGDFFDFDLIIGMDASNIEDLREMAPSIETQRKIHLIAEYTSLPGVDCVPDPYYGGSEGFERTIHILEDACRGLIQHLTAQ